MTKTSTTTTAPAGHIDLVGYGLAMAGAILFSTKGIFIKLAYAEGASTEILLALRMLVALPVYLVIMVMLLGRGEKLRALLTPKRVLASMAVGALGYYVSSYLDFSGLSFVTAQYERLVLFTYPFFVFIFGVWWFGDTMNWKLLPPMGVTYAGLLVIFGWNLAVQPEGLVIGTVFVLGSALTFAFYQHLARRQMLVLGPALFTCIGMSTAGVLAIGQSLVVSGLPGFLSLTPTIWTHGVMLGVFGTVLPSFLLNAGIARIGPRATSSTASFGPIATIALAVVVLGEDFTFFHAIGTALVLGGSALFAREEGRTAASKK
ncbi:MAG: DMT family transporter [Devosia sp.]|nr:DMT family transporter [Devosia sp.]